MTPKSVAGDSSALNLQGNWVRPKTGKHIATIEGKNLTWSAATAFPGKVTKIEFSNGQICMQMQGENSSAELGRDGFLRWSDGDVWSLDKNVDFWGAARPGSMPT